MDERDLTEAIVAVRGGALDRYERVVEALWPEVLGRARTLGLRGPDADDVCQAAFVKAWRRLGALDEPARFRPWLLSIAGNLARDHYRRCGRERRTMTVLRMEAEARADNAPAAFAEPLVEERRERLALLVERLRDGEREVVLLRFRDGLNCKEIAERLGKNHATVRSVLHRALATLKTLMTAGGVL